MNILPKIEEVRELAKKAEYKVVPLSCELLSDFITPIEAPQRRWYPDRKLSGRNCARDYICGIIRNCIFFCRKCTEGGRYR